MYTWRGRIAFSSLRAGGLSSCMSTFARASATRAMEPFSGLGDLFSSNFEVSYSVVAMPDGG